MLFFLSQHLGGATGESTAQTEAEEKPEGLD